MPTQITNGSLLLLVSNITVSGLVLHGGGDTTPLSILGDGNTVSSVLVSASKSSIRRFVITML